MNCHNCARVWEGTDQRLEEAVVVIHMPGAKRRYRALCKEHKKAFWYSHQTQVAELNDPHVHKGKPGSGLLLERLKAMEEVPTDDPGFLEWLAADAVMST